MKHNHEGTNDDYLRALREADEQQQGRNTANRLTEDGSSSETAGSLVSKKGKGKGAYSC